VAYPRLCGWTLSVVAVSCAHGVGAPAASRSSDAPPVCTRVPIERAKSELVVPVELQGRPERFILDTGASSTVVTDDLARALELPVPAAEVEGGGAGGALTDVHLVTLEGLTVGSRHLPPLDAVVMPAKSLAVVGEPVAGILGQDVLSSFVVEMDIPHRSLQLCSGGSRPVTEGMQKVPFVRLVGGLIRLDARLDETNVPAVLDSGAAQSVVNTHAARASHPAGNVLQRAKAVGADGTPVAGGVESFSLFQLGTVKMEAPSFFVADLPVFAAFEMVEGPGMILGLDFLGEHRVVIDYARAAVYL
jgi:predicted aspartyl protease